MNEVPADGAGPHEASAGRLLREARQAQGLHIAALASAIKVAPRKLELLEADRFDELPDPAFTRALAQTVCRTLKIDSAPVLALLPAPRRHRLESLGEGLNTPFRDHGGGQSSAEGSGLSRAAVWGSALVLLAAAAIYLVPGRWLASVVPARATADASASAVSGSGAASSTAGPIAEAGPPSAPDSSTPIVRASGEQDLPVVEAGAEDIAASDVAAAAISIPRPEEAASEAASSESSKSAAVTDAPQLLQLRASADSWVEVVDGSGQTLLSRTLKPGESVDLDGTMPMRLRIGNAPATEVRLRGKPVPLAPYSRGTLARLELK